MEDILKLTYLEVRKLLISKQISVSELVALHIKQAEKFNYLNLFITKTFDDAINSAKIEDGIYAAEGETKLGKLWGSVIANKDIFCTKGVRTTCASRMLENYVPQYESFVTQNLLNNGAISIGKLNMDEFAMGAKNENSYFGQSYNFYELNGKNVQCRMCFACPYC